MRYAAAYLLAILGGNNNPDVSAISKILGSVAIDCDENEAQKVIDACKGKSVDQLIEEGTKKLGSLPAGGAAVATGAGAGAAAPAAAASETKKDEPKQEAKKEEKKKDDSDDEGDMVCSFICCTKIRQLLSLFLSLGLWSIRLNRTSTFHFSFREHPTHAHMNRSFLCHVCFAGF